MFDLFNKHYLNYDVLNYNVVYCIIFILCHTLYHIFIDEKEYFQLGPVSIDNRKTFSAVLETNKQLDREDPGILDNGGLYIFQIKV